MATTAELIHLAYGGPMSEEVYRRSIVRSAGDTKPGKRDDQLRLGYHHYHSGNVRKPNGEYGQMGMTGWCDETLIREPRIVFFEAKGAKGKFRPGQIPTLNRLRGCGLEVFVWRVGTVSVEEILNYLRPKQRPECPWTDPAIIGPWL